MLLEEFGLPCLDCEARTVETIAGGVTYTGVDPDAVVARLNALPAHPPQAPDPTTGEA